MKKFYALALCGAVCLSVAADGKRFKSMRSQKGTLRARTEAAAPVWRPASQIYYIHDGEDWELLSTSSYKYDNRGNTVEDVVDEYGLLTKTVTTYDAYNSPLTVLQTESEDGETWENSSKRTYVYDSRIHDFFIERIGYDWTEGEWVKNYQWETNTITRNDDGNILEVVKALPYGGSLRPAYKSVWNYGADGKANAYYYYYYTIDLQTAEWTWKLYDKVSYRDIVWEKTDGQMIADGNLMEFTEGENLLKSAVVYYLDTPDGHFLVEYSDEGLPGFLIKETTNDINEVGRTVSMETLDANGSKRMTITEYFDEEGIVGPDPTYINVQQVNMDDHGNMVSHTVTETTDGVEELVDAAKYTYVYDADGNPMEITTDIYYPQEEEYFPMERVVYGEYIDAAGLESVSPDTAADWSVDNWTVTATAPGLSGITVCNLQGAILMHVTAEASSAAVNLSSLPSGIYLLRADGTDAVYRLLKR